MIETNRVSKKYSWNHPYAVQNVSLRVEQNKILGLLGPNGAGKSTLFNMITLSLKPTSGHIFLDGIPTDSSDIHSVRSSIGYCSEKNVLMNKLTVSENIRVVGLIKNLRS